MLRNWNPNLKDIKYLTAIKTIESQYGNLESRLLEKEDSEYTNLNSQNFICMICTEKELDAIAQNSILHH